MLWLKRNLVLVISGLVALVLLVVCGIYFAAGMQKNRTLESELESAKAELTRLYGLNPFPHATNVAKAREQTDKVQRAVADTKRYFVPVAYPNVSGQEFKTLLDNTVFELRRKAELSGVRLPETNYAFTFKVQKALVKFAQGSFPALPEMLADIKTISFLIFDAKCNLLNLRRERLTLDDPPGGTDYTEQRRETDPLTGCVLVPYEVQVSCFSRDLAALLDNFSRSTNGFIVKVLLVEPISGQSPEVKREPKAGLGGLPTADGTPAGRMPVARRGPAAAAAEVADNPLVLVEQALRASLLVKVVRPPEPATKPIR
jgi:hypothetical protein